MHDIDNVCIVVKLDMPSSDRSKAVLLLLIIYCYFCLVLLCFHARLFVDGWERTDLADDMAYFQSLHNSGCSFVVCGDMNARSKELSDMILASTVTGGVHCR